MVLIPWKDRRLPFGRPVEEMPLLLERMQGTPLRLAQLTRSVPHELLVQNREGQWSVMEHIAYLLYLDQHMHERVEDFLARRPRLCTIEDTQGSHDHVGHRERTLGDLLEEYHLTRDSLVRGLQGLEREALQHRSLHPCNEHEMSPVDMALWLAEHDDHRLVTIRRSVITGTDRVPC